MKFKQWLQEAIVETKNLGEAIKKTLEFTVPGSWSFDIAPHQWNRPKDSVRVTGHLKNQKTPDSAFFFLSAYAILEKPIESYDSITGDTDMRIVASFLFFESKNKYRKLGERSNNILGNWGEDDGKSLKTPYQLSQWINTLIDKFGKDDDPPDESPKNTPTPSIPQLVGVH